MCWYFDLFRWSGSWQQKLVWSCGAITLYPIFMTATLWMIFPRNKVYKYSLPYSKATLIESKSSPDLLSK